MKRSPAPQRKTPLEQKTALKRTTALGSNPLARSALHAQSAANQRQPRRPKPRSKPAVPPRVRAALALRSGGVCEMALPNCTGRATDPAHRIRTGMGGRKGAAKLAHDVLSNLTHACRRCHEWTHAEPTKAVELGLMLRDGDNPLSEPVLYRGTWCLLDDDSSVRYPLNNAKEAS